MDIPLPDAIQLSSGALATCIGTAYATVRWTVSRIVGQIDDHESRIDELEKHGITEDQLEKVVTRLESKLESGIDRVTDRLDRIIERQ